MSSPRKTSQQASTELNKLKDCIDRMVARFEGGQVVAIQSIRLLDGLALEVIKQHILNGRERGLELLDRARRTLESVPPEEIAEILESETGAKRTALAKRLRAVSELAANLREAALPWAFNPLDYKVLGRSIAAAIDNSKPRNMSHIRRFVGVGVYALYYVGDFEPYRPLVEKNTPEPRVPIYVGKAVPEGARIGGEAQAKGGVYDRLQLHAVSISQASSTLRLEDFQYRVLIVEPAFVPLGEVVLLGQYRPLWNSWLYGFGSNPAGGERGTTRKSLWDTLHPGRERTASFRDAWNRDELVLQVGRYLRGEDVDKRLLKLAQVNEASAATGDVPDDQAVS